MSDYRSNPPPTTNTTINNPAPESRSGWGMAIGGIAVVAIVGLVAWTMMDSDRSTETGTAPTGNSTTINVPEAPAPAAPAPAPAPEAAAPAPAAPAADAPAPAAPAPAPAN